MNEIQNRLRRITSALGDTLIIKFEDYKPGNEYEGKYVFLLSEVRGQVTTEKVHNALFSAIANVGSLKDNLEKWCRYNSHNPSVVEDHVKQSFHLQVVLDLWNGDKHGYPLTFSHSKRHPRVVDVGTAMSLSTGTTPHSSASLTFGARGPEVQLVGSGGGGLTVTAGIQDRSGLHLGDVEDFLKKSMEHWEVLLARFNIVPSQSG